MEEQSIRFTTIAGRRVAWAVSGEGPPLALGGWWMSHLEQNWRDPRFRAYVEALGRHFTVIRHDSPGIGISEPGSPPLLTVEEEMAVLAGVLDAFGAERFDLFAASAGGPVALAYASAAPERVGRLVLYGTYATGSEIADEKARDSILGVVGQHWGLGSRVLADIFMPEASGADRDAFASFQREAGSAELAARTLRAVYEFDVADRLDGVTAPALVLHRRDDRAIPFRLGRDLAARLPRATLIELQGADHFPWLGAAAETTRASLGGLGVPAAEPDLDLPGLGADPTATATAATAGGLSARELDVLRLVARGLSDREIAARLFLSPHTVHRHVANIRAKLGMPSRAAAAARAARLGLL